jgi:hypothetical protein
MFGLFKKNPVEKLEKQYSSIMTKAVEAQRNGDIKTFSTLSFEAEEILKKIDKIKEQASN